MLANRVRMGAVQKVESGDGDYLFEIDEFVPESNYFKSVHLIDEELLPLPLFVEVVIEEMPGGGLLIFGFRDQDSRVTNAYRSDGRFNQNGTVTRFIGEDGINLSQFVRILTTNSNGKTKGVAYVRKNDINGEILGVVRFDLN